MQEKIKLIKNTSIIGIGKMSTQVLTFFLLPLYTGILSPKDFGTYDFIFTLASFAVPFINFSLDESMFRYLIDVVGNDKKKKIIITDVMLFNIFSIIIVTIIILFINIFISYDYIVYLLFFIIASILASLKSAITRGLERIDLYAKSNFISSLLIILLNILFIVVFKLGISGLIWSFVLAQIITTIYVIYKIKLWYYLNLRDFDYLLLKDMLKYSFPLIPNSISFQIINLSDRLVVTGILGSFSNGILSISHKFPNLINTVNGFFYVAWKESASKAVKEDNSEEFYNEIYSILNPFLLAVTGVTISFIPFIFNIFINKAYSESYNYIPILLISAYFSSISGFYDGIFVAYKDSKIIGFTTTIAAIVNLVVNIILIYFIGLYAAVISTFIANFIVFIIRKNKSKKYVIIRNANKYFILFTLSCVVTYLVYFSNNKILQLLMLVYMIIISFVINRRIIFTIMSLLKRKLKKC